MSIWFEGSGSIAASPKLIASDLASYGAHCAAVLEFMAGISSAELLDDDGQSITIKTNEGTMRRTNIRKQVSDESVVIEFDELYEAGTKVSASCHYRHEFVPSGAGCEHRLVISNVQSTGFLGWLYRRFGARNIGKAVLASYDAYYSNAQPGAAIST